MTKPPEFEPYKPVIPLTPKQVKEMHQKTIPEEIILAVNHLLVKGCSESRIRVIIEQNEVIEQATTIMRNKGKTVERNDFFDKHWLDFEPIFRKAGWKVTFNKPGYNESFPAYWTFEG